MDSWNDKYLILTAVYIFDIFFAFRLKRLYWCCSPWGCKESDTTERLNNRLSVGLLPLQEVVPVSPVFMRYQPHVLAFRKVLQKMLPPLATYCNLTI